MSPRHGKKPQRSEQEDPDLFHPSDFDYAYASNRGPYHCLPARKHCVMIERKHPLNEMVVAILLSYGESACPSTSFNKKQVHLPSAEIPWNVSPPQHTDVMRQCAVQDEGVVHLLIRSDSILRHPGFAPHLQRHHLRKM